MRIVSYSLPYSPAAEPGRVSREEADNALSPEEKKAAGSCSSTARAWTAGRPAAASRARCRSRMACINPHG